MGISIGMVGIGAFGKAFIRSFRDHPLVGRIALCDLSAERLATCAREFQIEETYTSLDDICRSSIQALVIITQPQYHAAQAIQAMEAGKHVYTAVPVMYGPDGDELLEWCDKLVNTVKRTGMIYMLGETTFFRKETIYCRRRAAEGAFGQFVYGEGEYLHDWSLGLAQVARNRRLSPDTRLEETLARDPRRASARSGPMHYPTHSVSGVVSVMGAHMTEVSALGHIYEGPDSPASVEPPGGQPVFSNEVGLFRMSNGATARICEFRRVGHTGREGFRMFGTAGSFVSDVSGAKWVTPRSWEPLDLSGEKEPLPDPLASDLGGHGGSHAYLAHEFVDSVSRGRLPRINLWEALRYFVPGVMAHKSALRGGELLKIPDWGDPPA
ncbi:MAG: Gfo/Idh/MocA family oxidoreductase [Armatimonadetes bacterium]|nr:Gfo/Idh/MocA family oxidoreductase [Armatimonadota bacterium]